MSTARYAMRSIGQGRLMLIVCLIAAVFVVFFPARQLVEQRTQLDDLQTRLTKLNVQNQRLQNDIARLQDPGELEVLARERLGLVKPGEHAYLFVDPDASPAPPPVPTLPAHKPVWSRLWSAVTGFLRGRG
jgi:cell division protein FtsB